ncbi:hypothetical protein KUCAC02_005225 [Chaenocephalus aceratus]|uniref:Uncharacterized protein n=1 Tax=Chaenocephalus aceratus TaxID=36190 RepID=A0ACB9WNQ1_CHAAC|nr:hypothetical protein KUCAC02_005225 [Chaenocephalus aceratus]
MTQRSRRKTPEQDAIDHIILGRDKPFLEARFINTFKGRGVFTREYIAPSTFVVEYRGILGEIFPEEEITYNYGDSAWPWRLKEVCGGTREAATEHRTTANTSGDKMEVCGGTQEAATEHRTTANTSGDKMCHHVLTSAVISSLDNCHDCTGPVSSLKWIGFTCKLCSTSWHKTCFIKNNDSPMKDICLSSNEGSVSDKDYIPETASSSDGSSADEDCPPDSEANTDWDHLIATIRDSKPPHCKTAPTVSTKNCVEQQDTILNLKNNEVDQLANFLGHDIRVHRDFYRLPEATIEIAKISKILLAMEKGSLAAYQGKSLDEIEIEDELEPDLEEFQGGNIDGDDEDDGDMEHDGDEEKDGDNEEPDPAHGVRGERKKMKPIQEEAMSSEGILRCQWVTF